MAKPKTETSQPIDAEIVDEPIETGSQALEALTRAEVDIQISTAKRYPRVVSGAIKAAMEMATLDEDTAGSCFYSLKRKDKTGQSVSIEGPSIRLSEIMQSAWGNMRSAGRIVSVEEKTIRAQGMAFDLQSNSMASVEVQRSIWGKNGRYSPDMIAVTCNAAISIAMRNARFQVIPRSYVNQVLAQAQQASLGKAETMEKRRQKAMEWWVKSGVRKEELLAHLGRASQDDITIDDLIYMTGLRTSIREGQITIAEAFKEKAAEASEEGKATLESVLAGNVTVEENPAEPKKPAGKDKKNEDTELEAEAKGLFK